MKIRGLVSSDRPQWESLYRGYAAFYKVDTDDAKLDRLFTWLLDASHPCEGLVAEVDDGQKAEGALVGLAHFRAMPSPCLLYTSPSPRDRTRSRMPSSA